MRLRRLWLRDFRCYETADLELADGCTVVSGANGQGKTSLLEAVDWLAHGRSFRGVPDAALVRQGAEAAIVRAEVDHDGRALLVEAELRARGRNRVQVNGTAVGRRREVLEALRVTVFAPDDLALVKGPPASRRDLLDDLLVAGVPRYAGVRAEVERVLRQRNALLRGGVRSDEEVATLDVLDLRLASAGSELVKGRLRLVARLTPYVAEAYQGLAGAGARVATAYEASWSESPLDDPDAIDDVLRRALAASRRREIERGTTLAGPHRDDWWLGLDGLDARTHASQGEQRTYALALRLGGHRMITDVIGEEPVLLLDDVFSELDAQRATELVRHLPSAQTLLTTATEPPPAVRVDRRLEVVDGVVAERA